MIHTTIGVYPDGSYKVNGVKGDNIASHIYYNLTYRPGRALIVDGILLYKGMGVKKNHIQEIISKNIRIEKDTTPYH